MARAVTTSLPASLGVCAAVLSLIATLVGQSRAQPPTSAAGAFPPLEPSTSASAPGAHTHDQTARPDAALTKAQCIEAHRQAQQAQNEGHLVEAREQARACASLSCPGLLIADCARWLNELEQRMPSVVFEVRLDGHPNMAASVFADGKPVQEWTRGEALRLDPGEHTFRFVLSPYPSIAQTTILGEGMRFRVVSAEFKTPSAPPPIEPTPVPPPPVSPVRERPVPTLVYPLLGVGVAGLVSFTAFGLSGQSEQKNLEKTCAPHCTDDNLSTMHHRFLVGDISLGVGIAALLGAGVLYVARPEATTPTVGFSILPGGGAATLTMRQF